MFFTFLRVNSYVIDQNITAIRSIFASYNFSTQNFGLETYKLALKREKSLFLIRMGFNDGQEIIILLTLSVKFLIKIFRGESEKLKNYADCPFL